MKKILKYMAMASAVLAAASCVDLTTKTQSEFDESVVFANYALAENEINGIYTVFGQTNGHRGRYCPWYGFNTDIECYNSTTYDGKNLEIAAYDCTPTNSNMNVANDPYASIFTAVERANICIRGMEKYATDATKPLYGEALCARALLYAELLKAYGEVPARFAPVSPETIYINKEDKDVIYKHILNDLEKAIPLLPWPAATKHAGRMNRAFAEGLYARLALAASGYSLRPEKGKVGTGDAGSIRLSDDDSLSVSFLYPRALKYLKDCIDNSGVSLYEDYGQLWKNFNNMDMTPGKEVLYALPFSDSRGRWNYTFAIQAAAGTTLAAGNNKRGGSAGPTPTFYYHYGANDVRRDISCVNYCWENGDDGDIQVLAKPMNWFFGKFRFEWMTKSPYTGGNDDGIKPVYMRYSDVLLMAAEIANAQNDIDYAKAQLLKVRKRAYKGHESEAETYVNGLSQGESFFNAIVEERALEFVGEFLRKGDLIRWNMLKKALDGEKEEIEKMHLRQGIYTDLPENVYYKYEADGKTIRIYGLNPGEIDDPRVADSSWKCYTDSDGIETNYFSKRGEDMPTAYTDRINSIYKDGVNPEQRMWWPICATNLNNAQGVLLNDYGY